MGKQVLFTNLLTPKNNKVTSEATDLVILASGVYSYCVQLAGRFLDYKNNFNENKRSRNDLKKKYYQQK